MKTKRHPALRVWNGMIGRTNQLSPKAQSLLNDIETHQHRDKIVAGRLFQTLYKPQGITLAEKNKCRIVALMAIRQILNTIDQEVKSQTT